MAAPATPSHWLTLIVELFGDQAAIRRVPSWAQHITVSGMVTPATSWIGVPQVQLPELYWARWA